MDKQFVYVLDNKNYQVTIKYKHIRNIYFHFDGESFLVTCHRLTSMNRIKSGLDKYARKLVERNVKTKAVNDEYIYILGKKVELNFPGYIALDSNLISFKTTEEMNKKLRKWFLQYISERVAFYEKVMDAPHYLVKVRQMKTRYDTNNKSKKTITISLVLLHYSPEIIDSVIIHELAHSFVFNHSDSFYKVVYKYCPRYDILRKKLIRAEFE